MPQETSAIVWIRQRCQGANLRRKLGKPRTLLIGHQLNPDLIFFQAAGVHDPNYLKPRFLVFELHSDYIANFQFVLQAVNAGSRRAYILGGGLLIEGLIVCPHAPHTKAQV